MAPRKRGDESWIRGLVDQANCVNSPTEYMDDRGVLIHCYVPQKAVVYKFCSGPNDNGETEVILVDTTHKIRAVLKNLEPFSEFDSDPETEMRPLTGDLLTLQTYQLCACAVNEPSQSANTLTLGYYLRVDAYVVNKHKELLNSFEQTFDAIEPRVLVNHNAVPAATASQSTQGTIDALDDLMNVSSENTSDNFVDIMAVLSEPTLEQPSPIRRHNEQLDEDEWRVVRTPQELITMITDKGLLKAEWDELLAAVDDDIIDDVLEGLSRVLPFRFTDVRNATPTQIAHMPQDDSYESSSSDEQFRRADVALVSPGQRNHAVTGGGAAPVQSTQRDGAAPVQSTQRDGHASTHPASISLSQIYGLGDSDEERRLEEMRRPSHLLADPVVIGTSPSSARKHVITSRIRSPGPGGDMDSSRKRPSTTSLDNLWSSNFDNSAALRLANQSRADELKAHSTSDSESIAAESPVRLPNARLFYGSKRKRDDGWNEVGLARSSSVSQGGARRKRRLFSQPPEAFGVGDSTCDEQQDNSSWENEVDATNSNKLTKLSVDSKQTDISVNIVHDRSNGEVCVLEENRIAPVAVTVVTASSSVDTTSADDGSNSKKQPSSGAGELYNRREVSQTLKRCRSGASRLTASKPVVNLVRLEEDTHLTTQYPNLRFDIRTTHRLKATVKLNPCTSTMVACHNTNSSESAEKPTPPKPTTSSDSYNTSDPLFASCEKNKELSNDKATSLVPVLSRCDSGKSSELPSSSESLSLLKGSKAIGDVLATYEKMLSPSKETEDGAVNTSADELHVDAARAVDQCGETALSNDLSRDSAAISGELEESTPVQESPTISVVGADITREDIENFVDSLERSSDVRNRNKISIPLSLQRGELLPLDEESIPTSNQSSVCMGESIPKSNQSSVCIGETQPFEIKTLCPLGSSSREATMTSDNDVVDGGTIGASTNGFVTATSVTDNNDCAGCGRDVDDYDAVSTQPFDVTADDVAALMSEDDGEDLTSPIIVPVYTLPQATPLTKITPRKPLSAARQQSDILDELGEKGSDVLYGGVLRAAARYVNSLTLRR